MSSRKKTSISLDLLHKHASGWVWVGVIVALLVLVPFIILYVVGDQGAQNTLPEFGVELVSLPAPEEGAQTVKVEWLVLGLPEDELPVTGAYANDLPVQEEPGMDTAPPAGYAVYSPSLSMEEREGFTVYSADVPLIAEATFVRLYAQVGETNYWSEEYIVER